MFFFRYPYLFPLPTTDGGMKSLGIIRFKAHELASLGCGLLTSPDTPNLMRGSKFE